MNSRIKHSIEALPGLLARLDTLTESTRQLETALHESASDLRSRDGTQQKALNSVRSNSLTVVVHRRGVGQR